MHRRTILQAPAVALAGSLLSNRVTRADELTAPSLLAESLESRAPLFVATWPFGQTACERARDVLADGHSLSDAVEQGINLTELDETVDSVGVGGLPNADGIVQLDACFMEGRAQRAGCVVALEGFPQAISVARNIMETTPHVMLAGADAAKFAKRSGFEVRENMLTERAGRAWKEWRQLQNRKQPAADNSHDTIALLGLDREGNLVGGCSTSGRAFKLPGRVGDSPIIGSGLYVDGRVGAAGATGIGENVMRYCSSFLIVEFMRQGMSPTEACQAAIDRIVDSDSIPIGQLHVNFVAINKAGQFGAAGTSEDFQYAVVSANQSAVLLDAVRRT